MWISPSDTAILRMSTISKYTVISPQVTNHAANIGKIYRFVLYGVALYSEDFETNFQIIFKNVV